MKLLLLAGAGGSVGAVLRYVVSGLAARIDGFPAGTLVVNVAGSALLSIAVFGRSDFTFFFNVGVLGAFTTFSTFSYESFRMLENGETGLAVLNMVLNLALCSFGVMLGGFVAGVLWM